MALHLSLPMTALAILLAAAPNARAGQLGDDEKPWGELSHQEQGESNSLLDFFKERTKFGYGFDEEYWDNFFLEDNNKQNEFKSTLEAEIFFADPRGSVLYGTDWEVNAFRYHRSDANAVDHDVRAFFDYDPGGRTQWRTDYQLNTNNVLVYGPRELDLLRISKDFQRFVSHEGLTRLRYALNSTNALVSRLEYYVIDDQTLNDASGDRKELRAILDLDHDLKRGWTVFTGYGFKDLQIPGNKEQNTDIHSARLGTRYDATELAKLDLTLTFNRSRFKDGSLGSDFGINGLWKYQAGPRTLLTLGFIDEHRVSYQAGRRRFRTIRPTAELRYDLTPLIKLKTELRYEKQISQASDTIGGGGQEVTASYYDIGAGLEWQLRESTQVTMDYRFSRSKTGDQTVHYLSCGFESEFGGSP